MSDPMNVGISNTPISSGRIHGFERPESAAKPSVQHGRKAEQDQVDVSEHARHLASLRNLPPVRLNKIEAAKAAIANGDYDNDVRLNIAVERMLNDVQV